jgi:hypothetical protein
LTVCVAALLGSDRKNRSLVELADRYATALERLAGRPSDDVRILLDALIDGRRQMVNGLVATNIDPRAAQRLAIIEREAEAAERPIDKVPTRDLLGVLRDRAAGNLDLDYPRDDEGEPVHLVGS